MHDRLHVAQETQRLPCPGCGRGSFHPEAIASGGVGSWCPRCESYVDELAGIATRHPDYPDRPPLPDTRSEHEIQTAIKAVLKPFPVAVYDLSQPRAAMQTPGIPDLYVVGYGTDLWAEIKRPDGRLTAPQKLFRATCEEHGIPHAVWRSERDAMEWVKRVRETTEAA